MNAQDTRALNLRAFARFPRLNKNNDLEENDEQIREGSNVEAVRIATIVTMNATEWEAFTNGFLTDYPWLKKLPCGHDSDFALPEGFEDGLSPDKVFEKLYANKDLFTNWRTQSYGLVTLVINGTDSVYVNHEGFGYARYVGRAA